MLLSLIQIIGVVFTSFGLLYILIGVISSYDSSWMITGNLFFLAGLSAIMGFERTIEFFSRRDRLKGTICFVVGILLLFITWAPIWLAIEFYGLIYLSSDYFPMIINLIEGSPYIDALLSHPGISRIVDQFSESKKIPI